MHDDAVIAEPLDDGFFGAVEIDAATDDVQHPVHLIGGRRGQVAVHELGGFADVVHQGQAHRFARFRIQVWPFNLKGLTAGDLDYVGLVIGAGQGFLNCFRVNLNVVREGHRQGRAGLRLVHQVRATLQVQAEFQAQRAGLGAVQAGQAGYCDVDFRQGQGNGGYAQDGQYQGGQQNGAASHVA